MDGALLREIILSVKKFHIEHPSGIIILRGATATGKTDTAVQIASQIPCEIISADSRQFFRGMDIGTDKVDADIRKKIIHHQIDIIDPDAFYTAGEWKKDVCTLIPQIQSRNHIPLIVGGTGLYIDTLYKNYSVPEVQPDFELRAKYEKMEAQKPGILRRKLYAIDPDEANKHHPNSTRYIIRALEIYDKTGVIKSTGATEQPVQRPILLLGLRRIREDSNERIAKRVKSMIANGLIEEVKGLLTKGYTADLQSMQGIGYKETVEYLAGSVSLEKLEELITIHTQQYAKRQRTWFRRYISDAENNPKKDVVYKVFEV